VNGASRASSGERPHATSNKIGRVEWVGWFTLLVIATAAMIAIRTRLNQAHVALAYLLVVQGGSARGGRPLGIALAAVAFVCFDLFFLPPYGTFVVQDPLNWLVLVAFLGTSIVSAQLLYRAQSEASNARQRAEEIDRFAALGAETLNVARAEDALTAIVSVIRKTLPIDACDVFTATTPPRDKLVAWVMSEGEGAIEHVDGTTRVGVSLDLLGRVGDDGAPTRAILRPLQVRGSTVGVLRIACSSGLALTPEHRRILDALSYYAALGVERTRLTAEAERATALQEAHKAKDAVLASVSHDLRTPLTTIKGLAHEIAKGGDDRAAIIEDEADRLNMFVAQMLDLSRIASGSAVSDVQPNEAEDLLGAAAQRVAGQLGAHDLRIQVDRDGPLLFGRFDFAQTLRALVNLIENAAKYSPADTAIDLAARRNGEWLEFAVADRGRGVADGERDRIFESFYRPTGTLPDVAGSGLGLSIAQGIAKAQGGSIEVAARAGGGSVFTLRVLAMSDADLQLDAEPSRRA
jgi:two-component system sensor histidine kinase KdpD